MPKRRLAVVLLSLEVASGLFACRAREGSGPGDTAEPRPAPAAASLAPLDLFPDPALERIVRRALEKPTGALGWAELSNLVVLNADAEHDVRDLTGIGQLTSLTVLDLQQNEVRSIAPLSTLKQLVELNISHNQIADLTPLGGLRRLRELNASSNRIRDIGPLAGMERLERLYIDGNEVTEMRALAALTHLEYVMAAHNPIDCAAAGPHLAQLRQRTPKITTDCAGYQWFEEVLGRPRR